MEDEFVDAEDAVAEYSYIAVDKMGFPHIAYCSSEGVRYTVRDRDGWQNTGLSHAADIRTVIICIYPSGCSCGVDRPCGLQRDVCVLCYKLSVSDILLEVPGVLELQGVLPDPAGSREAVQFPTGAATVVDQGAFC